MHNQIKTSDDFDKDAQLNELFDEIEQGLEFVGCSAVEDKL